MRSTITSQPRGRTHSRNGWLHCEAEARIATRIARVAIGNFGDCKALRDGVWELRINWGPGYRVYYALSSRTTVLLLCGGDKRKQSADIIRSVKYWDDYQRRTAKP